MEKFIIIDGPAVLHRAWHALPKLTDPKGRIVSAVYGFSSLLLKLLREQKPQYLAVAFDTKAPTYRHQEYKEYKAGRVKQPQEFYDQIPMVKEILQKFGIKFLEKDGYEADDLIGSLVHQSNLENLIVTGDLDTLQLVNPQTKIYFLHQGISDLKIYDQEAVKNRYGLTPEQLIDFKALRGDPSDNISGVKGVGDKTASALLEKFGSLEKIYQCLEQSGEKCAIGDAVKKLLLANKDKALFDKKLVTINQKVPGVDNISPYYLGALNIEEAKQILVKFGFNSLIKRLDKDQNSQQAKLFGN